MPETKTQCLIIGAGLAGLTCAFELASRGLKPLVVEAEPFTATAPDHDGVDYSMDPYYIELG